MRNGNCIQKQFLKALKYPMFYYKNNSRKHFVKVFLTQGLAFAFNICWNDHREREREGDASLKFFLENHVKI